MSTSRRDLFRAAFRQAPAPALSEEELERYSRQLVLPEWGEAEQVRLRSARVLVVGAGALGSPVAAYLVGAGVGRLGVVDGDAVEVSNLHRQFVHLMPDVGRPKAESAAVTLQLLNPDVIVEPYPARLDASNAAAIVAGHDLVVDCTDSFETRYVVNAACCADGIPLVEAGVVGWSGLVMAIRPGETACYRCAFPSAPADAPSCAEAGVLGPAAGVVGSLQALVALQMAAGMAVEDGFVSLDLRTVSVTRVRSDRRAGCEDCGGYSRG